MNDAQILAAFGMAPPKKRADPLRDKVLRDPRRAIQDHWRARLANQGQLSAYKPTAGERIEGGLGGVLSKVVGEQMARRVAKRAMAPLNDLTPVGNVTGVDDGARDVRQGLTKGNLAQAALGAGIVGLNLIPFAGGAKRKLGDILRDEVGAIRAWHGSPHDFDKFSMDKIGTGEGAQAYGHGLYFAENKSVAEGYQRALAGKKLTTVGGYDQYALQGYTDPKSRASRTLAATFDGLGHVDFNAARNDALRYTEKLRKEAGEGWTTDPSHPQFEFAQKTRAEAIRDYDAQIAALREIDQNSVIPRDPGRLYEVKIDAEPEDFLDWNAPLSGHGRYSDVMRSEAERQLGSMAPHADTVGRFMHKIGTRDSAALLRKEGLPGVRYLDQGSRSKGNGTNNYVVFDDSLLSILSKQ